MEPTALEICDRYIRAWLPARMSDSEHRLLRQVGVPVAICLRSGTEERTWVLCETDEGLEVLGTEIQATCGFRLEAETYVQLIRAEISPQRAFFTGKLKIEGNKFIALKLGSLLESIFKRIPFYPEIEMKEAPVAFTRSPSLDVNLTERQRNVLALHLDENDGSSYWVQRAAALGLRADDLKTLNDLEAFGTMNRDDLARLPFRELVPRKILREGRSLILGETGGTLGAPWTVAWTRADFETAFVRPLVEELARRGFPRLEQWLFAGPTGPHIIGKAADALAQATTHCDALKIDFDPRWHRRMLPNSAASMRHLEHVGTQTLVLLEREYVDALFVTPSLLRNLLETKRGDWVERLKLVHLGGQSITPQESDWLKQQLGVGTELINGYGNSLFGCMVECDAKKPLVYRSHGERLVVMLKDLENSGQSVGEGQWGQVVFHRFDESALLLNVMERDEAQQLPDGLFCPRPMRKIEAAVAGGIY